MSKLILQIEEFPSNDPEPRSMSRPGPDRDWLAESDWTVEAPELREYAADLLSCLTAEAQAFTRGLRVVRETQPGFRGHICYLTWIMGNREIAASDYESLLHEIGHALDLREHPERRVSNSLERSATAFYQAADRYLYWMQSRRLGEEIPLALFVEGLADDARECLARYFLPEEQHSLYWADASDLGV